MVNNDALMMMNPLGGADIAEIMSSKGPVVKCVMLRCQRPLANRDSSLTVASPDDLNANSIVTNSSYEISEESKPYANLTDKGGDSTTGDEQDTDPTTRVVLTEWIDQVEIDTTPSKSMVAKALGGQFTFLGQYQDEGVVLMARNLPDDLEDEIKEKVDDDDDDDGIADDDDDDDDQPTTRTTDEVKELLSRNFKVSELKELCHEREIATDDMVEKGEVIEALIQYQRTLPPYNCHRLQPPLHKVRVRGDILILRVAETNEELDENDGDDDEEKKVAGDEDDVDDDDAVVVQGKQSKVEDRDNDGEAEDEKQKDATAKNNNDAVAGTADVDEDTHNADDTKETSVLSNEEFFLDYTKSEYVAFASRTDIPEHEVEYEEDDDDNNDEDDDGPVGIIGQNGEEVEEEEKSAVFNLVMKEVLKTYREENGRGPNTQELLELRANIAKELDFQVSDVMDGDWDKEAKRKESPSGRGIAFHPHDMVKEYVPDKNEYIIDVDPEETKVGTDDDDDEEEDDDEYAEPHAKRVKTSPQEKEEEDSKPVVGTAGSDS
jgi:hypothetical protein